MNPAQLETVLADFEARSARCRTENDVRALLLEFSRVSGLTGRVDQGIPMINGVVVRAELWAAFGPRFVAFRESLERKALQLAGEALSATALKRRGTFEVYFTAGVNNFETDEQITDRAVLALCHGASEDTGLEGSLDLSGLPLLPLPVSARVVFDDGKGTLEVAIAFPAQREPTESEAKALYQRLYEALDRGWGANYNFEVEGLADDLTVFFHAEPVGYKFKSG